MTPLLRNRPAKPFLHRVILRVLALLSVVAVGIAIFLYFAIMKPNVWTGEEETRSVFIPTGAGFHEVKNILYSKGLLRNRFTFEWLAKMKRYPELIKPGHYVLYDGMNNDRLINLLRAGEQTPVDVVFNSVRDLPRLAGIVAGQLEADSALILQAAYDPGFLSEKGLNEANASVIYIPNTYEFWWTTDAPGFRDRMVTEYHAFWDDDRMKRVRSLRMTIPEVVTLASIVERETVKNDEKAARAGVYINRLKKGWKLQADPTLVFAANDPTINRVLNIHKKTDSPYNTYLYSGLPPGPICIPSISSIDAVLNYWDHDYMFFCARDDLSGYHEFSRTLSEHNRNARAYQKALNERRVMK